MPEPSVTRQRPLLSALPGNLFSNLFPTAIFTPICRKCFDIISGYKHKPIPPNSNMTVEELLKGGYILNEQQWLAVSP